MYRIYKPLWVGVSAAFLLVGCSATGGGGGANGASETDTGSVVSQSVGCAIGGVAAALLAKALAASEARKQKLSQAEASKRERGYMLGLGLLGCGGGAVLAGTVYAKLSEAGKQARERELVAAASSAKSRTYADPVNPSLKGRVTPGPVYAEGSNRECRNVEDQLSDGTPGEPAVVKMCRSKPNGGWAAVTA